MPMKPIVRLHRPSFSFLHLLLLCPNFIKVMNNSRTDFPILNKLVVNGTAFEALCFPPTFNFLLLIMPTTQLVRNSEVMGFGGRGCGRDESHLPFSLRHGGKIFGTRHLKNRANVEAYVLKSLCGCTYSKS
jgi:hypothetical protein